MRYPHRLLLVTLVLLLLLNHAVQLLPFSSPFIHLLSAHNTEASAPQILSNTQIKWQGHIYTRQTSQAAEEAAASSFLADQDERLKFSDDKADKKSIKAQEKGAKKQPPSSPSLSPADPELEPFDTTRWWVYAACTCCCVICAALAAGLTVGLISIDPLDLQIILEADANDYETPEARAKLLQEKQAAQKLLPLISRHHFLLVTLLLLNSIANETLPLFLDRIVPSYVAVIISVTLVLIFGEILPSAVFTGANQLLLASRLTPLVWFCMIVFAPLAYPIACLLDCVLGVDELERYNRGELKALVKLQGQAAVGTAGAHARVAANQKTITTASVSNRPSFSKRTSVPISSSSSQSFQRASYFTEQPTSGLSLYTASPRSSLQLSGAAVQAAETPGLTTDEVTIITGALEMKTVCAGQVCIPMHRVFMLSMEDRLDYNTLAAMLAAGHSRVPVYDGVRHNIRGLLLVKRLIVVSPEDKRLIRTLSLRRPVFIPPHLSLYDCLNEFQRGVSHLAIVCDNPYAADQAYRCGQPMPKHVTMLGILTLEDLIEKLIKEDIVDETDPSGVRIQLEGVRLHKQRVQRIRMLAAKMNTRMTMNIAKGLPGARASPSHAAALRQQQQLQQPQQQEVEYAVDGVSSSGSTLLPYPSVHALERSWSRGRMNRAIKFDRVHSLNSEQRISPHTNTDTSSGGATPHHTATAITVTDSQEQPQQQQQDGGESAGGVNDRTRLLSVSYSPFSLTRYGSTSAVYLSPYYNNSTSAQEQRVPTRLSPARRRWLFAFEKMGLLVGSGWSIQDKEKEQEKDRK